MKKISSCLCVIVLIITVTISGNSYAFASTLFEEESDSVFFKTLEDILYDDGKLTVENIIVREPVYDLNLELLGFVYSMTFESSDGYALIINTNGIFEVTEIYLDASNPYQNYSGENVYVNFLLYLIWQDGSFIETQSGLTLNDEALDSMTAKAFYAADNLLYQTQEVVYYTNRIQNEYGLAKRHPAYVPTGITNGCTPAAGGNIIGYYTRFYPELIPGFTPGSSMGNYYLYKEMPAEAAPVIETLYYYMDTNVLEPGTTIDGFKSGMIKYCREKGRSINFSSCLQADKFNFNLAKQRFEAGLPVVMFVDTFSVGTLFDSSGKEVIDYFVGNACHAMAGFGYNEITYTLTNGQTRNDNYIAVASGLVNQMKGYFNINFNTQIDEFYSINIF